MKSDSRFIAHKKFGQHFLIDHSVVENIVAHAGLSSSDVIVEIGPGPGILTKALLKSPAHHLTSIEIDAQFWPSLEKLKSPRFSLLKQDALQVSIKKDFSCPVKIVANLPYNIGNLLILNWLEELSSIQSMTLMLQDEVVQRICSRPGSKSYGRLSILVQWLCEVKSLFTVPPQAFSPPPKVMSAVVQITPRPHPLYKVSKKSLEHLTHLVFHQRRKMIGTSLKQLKHPSLEDILKKADISPTARPEELSVLQFCRLTELLEDYLGNEKPSPTKSVR